MSSVAELLTPQSAARNTRGRVPLWQPKLNETDEFDITVNQMSVALMMGAHDSFSISCQSESITTTEGMIGSTLNFRWGTSPRIETWHGYITGVQEDSASQGALSFTLTVLGTTKRMFEGSPQWWSNKSISNAVRDLANKNYLGYHGTDHPYLWHALAQTSESDWGFVNDLAKRIGYIVSNRYGVVQCYEPLALFRDSGVFTNLVASDNRDLTNDRILLDFAPSERSDAVATNLGTIFGYFTSGGDVQTAKQPGKYLGYIFGGSDRVLRDQGEAEQYLNGLTSTVATWKQEAVARIYGDADLFPGMCVNVVTTNRRYLRDKYDGKWLVSVVSHEVDRQSHQSQLYLIRPEATSAVNLPPYTPFWQQGASRPKPTLSLSTDTWVSSWNDRTLRSIL